MNLLRLFDNFLFSHSFEIFFNEASNDRSHSHYTDKLRMAPGQRIGSENCVDRFIIIIIFRKEVDNGNGT